MRESGMIRVWKVEKLKQLTPFIRQNLAFFLSDADLLTKAFIYMYAEHHKSVFLDYSGSWPYASQYYNKLVDLYKRFSLKPDPELESRFKAEAKKSKEAHQLQEKRQKKREIYKQRLGIPVQTKNM
ncbi:hypothetical protein V8E54_011091 [Elaphomyces granulatus]